MEVTSEKAQLHRRASAHSDGLSCLHWFSGNICTAIRNGLGWVGSTSRGQWGEGWGWGWGVGTGMPILAIQLQIHSKQ